MNDRAAFLDQWATWKIALCAFLVMILNDLVYTIMTVQEAHYQAYTAGIWDVIGFLTGFAVTVLCYDSIQKKGLRNSRSMVILASVSLANYFGTLIGVLVAMHLH